MNVIDYIFIGAFALSVILGLIDGFIKTLFGFIGIVISAVVSAILTPTISKLNFVVNSIEDTALMIGGTEFFALRTIVVALALFVLCIILCSIIKGIFGWLFKRVHLFKVLDKILGLVFGAGIIWIIGGALYGVANAGESWILALQEQVNGSGAQIDVANVLQSIFAPFKQSALLPAIYDGFNPIGDMLTQMLVVG